MFNEVQLAEIVFETFVEGDGNRPENEGLCIDVFECVLIFVLDEFPEDADSLVVGDLDREDVTGVIAEHETIEFEESLGVGTWMRNYSSHKYYKLGRRFMPTHQ